MLKLPKSWEARPEKEALLKSLEKTMQPVRAGSPWKTPTLFLDDRLKTALLFARRCGKMRGGLENIETLLRQEEAGYESLARRGMDSRPTAITRILCISDDGSDRFYRHCETLVSKYEPRILCLKLQSSSTALGSQFFGKEASVKAFLVEQKEFVERVLLALVPA
jgi:hypothetical protein